jgi:hypothetical protein
LAYVAATGKTAERLQNALIQLQYAQEARRGTGALEYVLAYADRSRQLAYMELQTLLKQADERQCRNVAAKLFELDQSREPWSQLVREQHLIDRRASWMSRYWAIMEQWRGTSYEWHYEHYRNGVARERALAVMYALRAYCLDHKTPPNDIRWLIPALLPAVPDDPFGKDRFKLSLKGGGVVVYCVGEDGDDDHGDPYKTNSIGETDTTDGDAIWPMTAVELGWNKSSDAAPPAK